MEKLLTLDSFNENDGKIVLRFLDDDLELRGDFYPSKFNGRPISRNYIRMILDEYKVIFGINKSQLFEAYRKCTNEHLEVFDVPIAKGTPPVHEIPEHLQRNPYLDRKKEVSTTKHRIDHRVRSPFIIVKKGQALAVLKSRRPGKNGINVLGEAINYRVMKPESVSPGENTIMDGKFLVSTIDGQLVLSKGTIAVNNTLIIKGPVDYHTGNISFPGDVFIEGPVSDGFKIYSGGNIVIKQTFDVSNASSKGDLNVAGGIIGKGQGIVKVGGNLKTKFIENCLVACRKTVSVDSEIINSKIYTMENIQMSEKGRIIGGEIYAIKGLLAGGLGKKTGKAAHIHCGVDFTKEQGKERRNGRLRMLSIQIRRLKELMETSTDEKKIKLQEALIKLEEDQKKTQTEITHLLESMMHHEDAIVEITGEIVPGTLIEICNTALYVTEPLKKVRIRLDKEKNKLVTEDL